MPTPIDRLKDKYESHEQHLKAIEDAVMKQFDIKEEDRRYVSRAIHEAFKVGHQTTTTDDWADMF